MRRRLHNDDWGYETNCFVCEQRNEGGLRVPFFHETERNVVEADLRLSDTYSGAPTLLHGGVLLAVLDEAMAWATIAIAGQWALTSASSAKFLQPVQVDQPYVVRARVVGTEGDRIATAADILDATGAVCTSAEATFLAIGEAVAVRLVGEEIRDEHRGFLHDGDGRHGGTAE